MPQTNLSLPTSEHFELKQISPGVYAAIAIKGGAAFSNAGIIDLGDSTLIFDTFETPLAAADLRAAAEQLTGRPAAWVIISHFHTDHWMGNQIFADATIIATQKTREQMLPFVKDINTAKEDTSEWEAFIREEKKHLEAETDERRRTLIKHSIARWQYNLEALPTLELRLPNQTVDGKLVFHGTQRVVELLTLEVGHTSGDCYLILPEEDIVFMGDLAFFERQPFMPYCEPAAWVAQLEDMERSEFRVFVPGHGPLGKKDDITLQKEYITTLEEMVAQAAKNGESVEEFLERPLPSPFDAWSIDGMPQEANVRMLFERLTEQGAE